MTESIHPLPTTTVEEGFIYRMEFIDGQTIMEKNTPEELYRAVANSSYPNFILEKMKQDIEATGEFKYCSNVFTIKKINPATGV